ncbi:cytochrome P450 [Archangium violaceum]|uniref:cytochrome P450 n=1 Tax=Archangium violaceum TaxID=83451 RepID=UPI00195245C5|nr:cytochrome P450 [Archangium violaceum]QRO02246.1 cytochrome P450 [Archangium violaceum]
MNPTNPMLTPEVLANPYPFYAALRESTHPVQKLEALMGCYVVTRHEDIVPALRNPALFSSKTTPGGRPPEELGEDLLRYFQPGNSLLFNDPPLHTRLRTLVSRAFTPRRIADLEPRIRELASGLLDTLLAREEPDFVTDLAEPLPVIVIAEMLGIEPERREDFKRWSDAVVQSTDFSTDKQELPRMIADLRDLNAYLEGAIERRRQQPREDLISALLEAGEQEGLLAPIEVIAFTRLLLVAGNETTTNLLGNGLVALIQHPSEWEKLAADPSLIPNAIEEMLRYEPPAHAVFRETTADTELGGQVVPKGSRVMFLIAAANRDPRKFPEPDRFDITREAQGHLSFGHGIHFCLGAPLSRLEAKVAFEELFRRVRRVSFASGQEGHIDWGGSLLLRGPRSLRLRFERR